MIINEKQWALAKSCFLILGAALLLAGCSGGNSGAVLLPVDGAAAPDGNHVPAGSFELAAPGPDTSAGLKVQVGSRGGHVIASVVAAEQRQFDAVLFELHYDAARYVPQVVHATEAYAPLSGSLCLERMDTPGIVSFGQVSLSCGGGMVEAGEVLAEVLFTAVDGAQVARVASDVPIRMRHWCV